MDLNNEATAFTARRIAVASRAGNLSVADVFESVLFEDQSILPIEGGWVQFRGVLPGDTHPQRGEWLGVSWDTSKGTRSNGLWKGVLLFESASDSVSFLRAKSLQPWSLEGLSFVEAIAHRYGYEAQTSATMRVQMEAASTSARTECQAEGGLIVPKVSALWDTGVTSSQPQATLVGIKSGQNWMSCDDMLSLSVVSLGDALVSRATPSGSCFHDTDLSRGLLQRVRSGSKFLNLIDLDLSKNVMLSDWSFLADILLLVPNLKSLNLSGCSSLFHKLSCSSSRFQCLSVCELNLVHVWGCTPTDTEMGLLKEFLLRFPNLTSLYLSGNHVPDDYALSLMEHLPGCLEELDLSSNHLTDFWKISTRLSSKVTRFNISDNPLKWTACLDEHAHVALSSLNLDRTSLMTLETFFEIAIACSTLRELRSWRNPVFDNINENEDQDAWQRLRYLRWACFPFLVRSDGEAISQVLRTEAERYVISLVRRKIRINEYFGPVRSRQRRLASLIMQRLYAQHELEFDESDLVAAEELRLTKRHIATDKLAEIFSGFDPSTLRLSDETIEALNAASKESVSVKICFGERVFTCILPTVNITVEEVKILACKHFQKWDLTECTLIWDQPELLKASNFAQTQCSRCLQLMKEMLPRRYTTSQAIVLEPDYNTLSYFGLQPDTDHPIQHVLLISETHRHEHSYSAQYARSLDNSVGHGILKRLT